MAARGDYMTESLVDTSIDEAMLGTSKSKQEFIDQLVRRGHFGPFEHAKAYFAVEGISRSCMAQLTRHRHMSFDVQSMRYVDFSEAEPVIPPQFEETHVGGVRADAILQHSFDYQMKRYQLFVDEGVEPEDARFLLPLSTPVNLTFSANIRSLFHFIDLRRNMKAQWEIRNLADSIADSLESWAPLSYSAYDRLTNNNSLRAP
jgi:thymidylate synthase (FAD)